MITMTVFTTGRLAAYERMMQDYGERKFDRGRDCKVQRTASDEPKKVNASKVGDSRGSDKS